MDAPNLKVHDINVTEQVIIGNGGKAETQRRLTFWVGDHGPFTKVYGPGEGGATQYKLDIQKEIDDLSALHQWAV